MTHSNPGIVEFTHLAQNVKARNRAGLHISLTVGRTGQMSNLLIKDLLEIQEHTYKLNI
jgi:hypothetical protein